MNSITDFEIKQRKYMPVFPKASGKTTVYIEGYPGENDEPMAATGFHGVQITTLYDQLKRYFEINDLVRVGVDSFIFRLLRPYLPDGTPITTSMEEKHLKEAAEARLEEEVLLREVETQRRQAAETRAAEEAHRRQAAEAELERLRAQLANSQNNN